MQHSHNLEIYASQVKPTGDYYTSGHLVLSHLGLAFVLMLRPFSTKLVMFPDFAFLISFGISISLKTTEV